MQTTTTTPNVPPPARAATIDSWQPNDPQPYRVIFGADRMVTDHEV